MIRLALATTLALIAVPTVGRSAGPTPCVARSFETEMVKAACEKGGQDEARKQMSAFILKQAPKPEKGKPAMSCKACHSSLAPKFERTPDALSFYKALGGK